jgi:hypothetical protein
MDTNADNESYNREDNFTTIKVRRKALELMREYKIGTETTWETYDRLVQQFAVNQLKKKSRQAKQKGKRGNRVINKIEHCFFAYADKNVFAISFNEIKDWVKHNSRYGISSPELSNYLRRRPQFQQVKRIRRQGTNDMETYWVIGEGKKGKMLSKMTKVGHMPGWIEVLN